MAGNLEYAVRTGINDRRMIPEVFLSQFLKDHRSGSGFVADAFMADGLLIGFHEVGRKAVRECGKRRIDPHACNFPVA